MVDGKRRLTPCSPGDPDALEMSWDSVSSEELLEPDVGIKDFTKALKSSRSTISHEDLKRNADWTEEFGSEGA